MTIKRLIRISIFIFIILILFFLMPSRLPVQVSSPSRIVMGTFAKITVVAPYETIAQRAINKAFERLDQIDKLMSNYKKDSEVSKVNLSAADEPVTVSDETFYVLEKSKEFSQITNGAFDITVAPVIVLWENAAEANQPPTAEQIQQAEALVGYDKMQLNPAESTVSFSQKGVAVDVGGIAKGYAIDEAVKVLKEHGVTAGLVDVGGDIRCFGKPLGKESWVIALQNPNLKSANQQLLKLKLNDKAVATSGNYERFYTVASQRQSHIIDSTTGEGAHKLSSVTVIADDAVGADAVATAISVMGKEKAQKLIDSMGQKGIAIEAILISPAPKYEISFSRGAKSYVVE